MKAEALSWGFDGCEFMTLALAGYVLGGCPCLLVWRRPLHL